MVGFVNTTGVDEEKHGLYAEEARLRNAHREWQEAYRFHQTLARRRRVQKTARRANRRTK